MLRDDEKVGLRKTMSVWNGISVVIGLMVGSGIFISPRGIAEYSGSVGFSLIIWAISGLVSIVGAQAYMELGTMLPNCGGDYEYIQHTYGSFMGFLYAWVMIVIVIPASNAIAAITFANYVPTTRRMRGGESISFPCAIPQSAMLILAMMAILLLTFTNSYSTKFSARVQDAFGAGKILALLSICGMGAYAMAKGNVENFSNSFEGTRVSANSLIQALYNGLYCYLGWNYLNFMAGEMRDVKKNLPRAIRTGMFIVVVIFILVNVAYFSLLTPTQMAESNAVAVTFGSKLHPGLAIFMSVCVALSTFGFLNGALMTTSRITFAAAKRHDMPQFFGLISRKHFTPISSLIIIAILTTVEIKNGLKL